MSEQDLRKGTSDTGGLTAPVLPLRDIVVFPHMIVPLFVGREKSVRALEEVMNEEKQILLAHPEECGRRRSDARRPAHHRHDGDRAAAAEAARPDRARAGRRQGARPRHRLQSRAPISSRPTIEKIPEEQPAMRRKPRR